MSTNTDIICDNHDVIAVDHTKKEVLEELNDRGYGRLEKQQQKEVEETIPTIQNDNRLLSSSHLQQKQEQHHNRR